MQVERRTEYAPVTESGALWAGRTLQDALEAKRAYPAGGTYLDGQPWDGVTKIVKREVITVKTDWSELG